ncbi:MAG: ATP-binding cassette domain-containing protein [Parvibaculaceae bacterium]
MAKLLSIEGLRIAARRHASAIELVRGIDLTVAAGAVTALVGASGCGKSLTCLGLQDNLPPGVTRTGGRVAIDGRPKTGDELRGRLVATVLQNPRSAFNPVMTMRAHAVETLKAAGRHGADADARILAALDEVGLEEPERLQGLYPFQMSGGMLQRMMIALALLSEAPFLLADEPTTDLDLVLQARVLDLIGRLVEKHGLGVLLVTHDMGVVAYAADTVAVMEAGRIVERGTVADVFGGPRHPVAKALVAAHLSLYPRESAA